MAITITTNSQTIVISAGTPTTNLSQINTSDLGYNNAQEELTAHEQAIATIPTTEEKATWNGKQDAIKFAPEADNNSFSSWVRSVLATGLSLATNSAIEVTDTFIAALGKLQAQITALIARVSALEPLTGVTFTGEISLGKLYTQYATYTPTTNLAVTLNATKVIGGSADIRMIGNGTNTPTFAAFTKHPSSGDYVNTLGTINYIVFYFNGTESLYSINQL